MSPLLSLHQLTAAVPGNTDKRFFKLDTTAVRVDRDETSYAARRGARTPVVLQFVGYVDSRRVNCRVGRTLLSGFLTIPEADGVVNHPGGHDLSIASTTGSQDRRQARTDFDHPGDRRHFFDRHPDVVADELLR